MFVRGRISVTFIQVHTLAATRRYRALLLGQCKKSKRICPPLHWPSAIRACVCVYVSVRKSSWVKAFQWTKVLSPNNFQTATEGRGGLFVERLRLAERLGLIFQKKPLTCASTEACMNIYPAFRKKPSYFACHVRLGWYSTLSYHTVRPSIVSKSTLNPIRLAS